MNEPARTTPMAVNPTTMELAWATVMAESIAGLAWSADGDTLYAGSADGQLVGLLADGDWRFRCQAHDEGITRVCAQPGGTTLATAAEDGRVRLWQGDTGDALATAVADRQWIDHLAWSPDGTLLAAAAGARLHVTDPDGASQTWEGHPGNIGAIRWAPSGKRLASGANKGVHLWNVDSWEPVRVMDFPGASVALAWSADGKALATGTQDGFLYVRLHAPGTAPRLLTMSGYPGKVSALAWQPRGRPGSPLIATCGGSDVVLWRLDPRDGKREASPLRHHDHTVTALAWSGDGRWLTSGDRNGRLCLWTARGALMHDLALGSEITLLGWHPRENHLAVGSVDGTLRLFRLFATAD